MSAKYLSYQNKVTIGNLSPSWNDKLFKFRKKKSRDFFGKAIRGELLKR